MGKVSNGVSWIRGYKCLDISTRTIFVPCHVIVDESIFQWSPPNNHFLQHIYSCYSFFFQLILIIQFYFIFSARNNFQTAFNSYMSLYMRILFLIPLLSGMLLRQRIRIILYLRLYPLFCIQPQNIHSMTTRSKNMSASSTA